MQQKSQETGAKEPCKSYFDLVKKIGAKGKYQRTLVLLFVWALYSGGAGQLGPTFFFIMQSYSCENQGLLSESCIQSVCALPQYTQSQYLDDSFNAYTIPVQYKYHQCEGSDVVNIIYGFIYFGFIIGVFIRAFIVDSYGRRPLMIVFNGSIVLGSILAVSSINIWITGIGFFLVNCGSDGATKMSLNYLTEYYDPQLRQQYSVLTQSFYTVAYMIMCISSYLIYDWRITCFCFLVVPSIAGFIFCICYLKQTPRYLMKGGEAHMVKVLNEIATINKGQKITSEDINNINAQKSIQQERASPLLLCKYSSLRKISVCYFIIIFLILTLYYGSSILVDAFGLNPYLVGGILATADLTVYYPAYKKIQTLKRKTTSLILSLIIAGTALGLTFIANSQQKQQCLFCFLGILEIVLLLIFRFSVCFLYVLVLIYSNQLYPEKVRSASSILQIFGGFSLVINPALLSFLQKSDINPMIYFTVCAMISFGMYEFLPETHGRIKEEIDQLQNIKKQSILISEKQWIY